MAFFLIRDRENIFIDKVGESIYLRYYPGSYSQKSTVIARSNYPDYSACLGTDHLIHFVYKSSQNSILHLQEKAKTYSSQVILEDNDNNYQITNLQILADDHCYLFYTAKNPYVNCFELNFQSLAENKTKPRVLAQVPELKSKYQCILYEGIILLCAIVYKDSLYQFILMSYDPDTDIFSENDSFFQSEYPIADFCFIVKDDTLYIAYVVEKIGHFQLNMGKLQNNQFTSQEIQSGGQRIRCKIFQYRDILWLNTYIGGTLHALFSLDHGEHFSQSCPCTLQNNSVTEIQFFTDSPSCLFGTSFYGIVDSKPQFAILSQIDTEHILYYTELNNELRALLSSVKPHSKDTQKELSLQAEIDGLKKTQQAITSQYNQLAEFAKELQNEGKKWKKKYYRATKGSSESGSSS